MENCIQVFENSGLGSVHVVMQGDEPWFVAKDVCDCLELDLASGARGLDDDEKGLHTMQTPGGALGYPESSLRQLNNLFGHVPDEWRGVTSVVTPFGEQTMLTISEQGLF